MDSYLSKMTKEDDDEMWVEDVDHQFQSSDDYNLQTISKNFEKNDYIMEPSIFLQLKR